VKDWYRWENEGVVCKGVTFITNAACTRIIFFECILGDFDRNICNLVKQSMKVGGVGIGCE